jgi:hypothetical protein
LKLDIEQSSSSTNLASVQPKLDTPVWETKPSDFPRLTNFTFPFGHLIALLDLDQCP